MPDQRVQDEQGNIHVFPDEATPEMIAKAMGVVPPSMATNLKTGQGMEAQAQQQAGQYLQQRATAPYEQQQAELQRRKNLAVRWEQNNPTPVTNASMLYAPVAAAKSIIGAKLGGMAGNAVGGQTGQVVGGLAGGIAGGVPWSRRGLASTIVNPETLEPRTATKILPWMPKARVMALGDILDPNLPKMRSMLQATEESMPNRIEELAQRAKQENILGQENAAAIRRADQQPNPFPQSMSSAKPIGNAPLPPVPEGQPTPFPSVQPKIRPGAQQEVGLVPEPRELTPADRPGAKYSVKRKDLLGLAQRGEPGAADVLRNVQSKPILYEPRGGTGYPGPRPEGGIPQGAATPFEQPLKVDNAMGIRWASDGTNRISIPSSVANADIEAYARPKLAEQAQIRSGLPWMGRQ